MTRFNLSPFEMDINIKSRFNHSSISQKTDERIMYSIPKLLGSSDSLVVNLQAQGFNYGLCKI